MIEITEAEIWALWKRCFKVKRKPKKLTTEKAYDAVLMMLGAQTVKEELRELRGRVSE